MEKDSIYHPVYNIKAISRLAGLLPVTLRAWERRYGLPQPQRGDQGYRYYSEHDLRTLLWIKKQMESGMSISRAIEGLVRLRGLGKDPVMNEIEESREQPISIQAINDQLYKALLGFDEQSSAEVMRRAFGIYLVDQVLIEIVKPTLVKLGDAWHSGEIPIATEHFATQFFMQHLMSMISASAPPSHSGRIVAACAPGEMHQIGIIDFGGDAALAGLGCDLPGTGYEIGSNGGSLDAHPTTNHSVYGYPKRKCYDAREPG